MVAKFLTNLKQDARVYRKSLLIQLRSAAALRGAFIAQIAVMILNNIGIIAAWLFLFNRFGTINGWSGKELIALQGINMLIFGIMMLLSVGIVDLPRHVDQGSFDTFLTRPSSVLSQIASSNIDVTTIGDTLLGIVLTGWYLTQVDLQVASLVLFVVSMVVGCVIFWTFAILLPNILAFYVFDSERLTRYVAYVFLDGAIYPTGVLTGVLRTILLTVFPALLVGAVQVDLLRGLHWWQVGAGAIVAAIWLPCALWLFRRSVRRYESANLVGAR
jgi:ABC-2 type transport system permease protein